MKMANLHPSKLTITWLLICFIFINQKPPTSARNLGSSHQRRHHHSHHKTTFYMQDVFIFNGSHPTPKTTKLTSHQLPFPKPLGIFPPNRGIPISESDPATTRSSSTQTLDVSSAGIFFPATATLQELEFGTVVVIDDDLFEHYSLDSSARLGKAQGIYVASSDDGTGHMMAMTTSFSASEFKDSLRFFGVRRKDGGESHIAVIGGTGKYNGANGYATVKASDHVGGQEQEAKKLLLFNVYLS